MPKGKRNNKELVIPKQYIFRNGEMVWGCFSKKWWPALIADVAEKKSDCYQIIWFSDYCTSVLSKKNIRPFKVNFKIMSQEKLKRSNLYQTGLEEAIEYLARKYSFTSENIRQALNKNCDKIDCILDPIPSQIQTVLDRYKEELKVKKCKQETVSNNVVVKPTMHARKDPTQRSSTAQSVTAQQSSELCAMCTSMDIQREHLFFQGLYICQFCWEKMRQCLINEELKECCIMCFGKDLDYKCYNELCETKYCESCITSNCSQDLTQKTPKDSSSICFHCQTKRIGYQNDGTIPRVNLNPQIHYILNNPNLEPAEINHPLRVLALYDTLASGLRSLLDLNVEVEVYYTVETNIDAIGDDSLKPLLKPIKAIKHLTADDIIKLGQIDLVFLGSPSNEANTTLKSLVNGIEMYEFYRLLEVLKHNGSKNLFWVFETPLSSHIEYRIAISRFLKVSCLIVKENWIALQQGSRIFWSNFPTLQEGGSRKPPMKKRERLTYEEQLGFPKGYVNSKQLSRSKIQELLNKTWHLDFVKQLLSFFCKIVKPNAI